MACPMRDWNSKGRSGETRIMSVSALLDATSTWPHRNVASRVRKAIIPQVQITCREIAVLFDPPGS